LILIPTSGDVIPGSGGIRKIRWSGNNRGKRGGTRILYYYQHTDGKYLMLYAYSKNTMEDLTKSQLKKLYALVKEEIL